MLDIKIRTIKAEKEYPLYCDFNVLEYLQENYGSIEEYQIMVTGIATQKEGKKESNIRAILDGLRIMINEGMEISEGSREKEEPITISETGKLLRMAGLSLNDARGLIIAEIADCILPKKKEQETRKDQKKMLKSTSHESSMWGSICSVFRKKK